MGSQDLHRPHTVDTVHLRDVAPQAVDAPRVRHFQSIPVGLAVDGANHQDMQAGVRPTVDRLPVAHPTPSLEYPQSLCLDKGYDSDEVRRTLDESEERCSVITLTGGVHSPFINNPRMGTVVMQDLGSGTKSNLLD